MGPIEVRSRTLALETSGCAHVQRYMSALSRRGNESLVTSNCALPYPYPNPNPCPYPCPYPYP